MACGEGTPLGSIDAYSVQRVKGRCLRSAPFSQLHVSVMGTKAIPEFVLESMTRRNVSMLAFVGQSWVFYFIFLISLNYLLLQHLSLLGDQVSKQNHMWSF